MLAQADGQCETLKHGLAQDQLRRMAPVTLVCADVTYLLASFSYLLHVGVRFPPLFLRHQRESAALERTAARWRKLDSATPAASSSISILGSRARFWPISLHFALLQVNNNTNTRATVPSCACQACGFLRKNLLASGVPSPQHREDG